MINNSNGEGGGQIKKRGCIRSKDNFLSEESFQSWSNYVKELGSTKSRLKDRLFARSLDHVELNELRARSHSEMKKTLHWWDLLFFGLGGILCFSLIISSPLLWI